jgi:hypothetical protein
VATPCFEELARAALSGRRRWHDDLGRPYGDGDGEQSLRQGIAKRGFGTRLGEARGAVRQSKRQ